MRPSFVALPFKASTLLSVAAAVMLSACSSSVERFADNPSDADPVYTASVPKDQEPGDSTVSSKPLDRAPIKSSGSGYSYPQGAQQTARAGEESDGGVAGTVRVEPGMTLYSIAKANGMTVKQLAAANGIPAPYSVRPGQVLRIPGRAQAVAPRPSFEPRTATAEPAYAAPEKSLSAGSRHTVKTGETLYSLGRRYGVSPFAIADLNGLSHSSSLKVGQVVRIPAGAHGSQKMASAEPESQPVQTGQAKDTDRLAPQPATKVEGGSDVSETGAQVPEPVQKQAALEEAPETPAEPALPTMRWPVKGKVISGYGAKPNGLRNEGINIAVPEGTSVRAAESGIVAYAGNELKGYGNLVLIRHDNGWVTAYAHNKELFVKRGDAVKRGDVIAKAGQTGSVSSPQLHFEVRKGATAMDPMKFLGSATASN